MFFKVAQRLPAIITTKASIFWNVFQCLPGFAGLFLRDSGIAKLFHGFLWKMLEDVLESVEMSNVFPGRRDIYKLIRVA